MEFSVIHTGGKQYKVSVGDIVKIEKIKATGGKDAKKADFKKGDTITFDKVLLQDDGASTTIGMPYIAGARVVGTLEEIGRDPKIDVIKYKQKSRYFKKNGHRQPYFKVKIQTLS